MVSNANIMTLRFYTYVMLKMLYACDSLIMSVYDITEHSIKRGFLIIVDHKEC